MRGGPADHDVTTVGALLGLGGLPAPTRRGLTVAFSTSVAVIMGVNLVYPVLPPLMEQLLVDEAAIGLVIAAYTLPSVFLTPIAGALADLHGRRPLHVLVGLSLVVYGMGNGMISPLQKSVLTRNAPPELRGGVISLDRLLQQIAKSLAPAAMGLLLLVADVTAVFWALGLLSLAACALASAMLGLRERTRQPRPTS